MRPNETKDANQPWHWVVIPAMGLCMGEIFYLKELAEDCDQDGVYEFFFCGPPLIITGGTGLTGRDVTPDAIEPLFSKRIDGFSVVFHMVSYQSVGLSTLQSRATAGLIGDVFVFCMPGSNGAVKDGWDKVISAQLDSRHRPCNFIEIMPRLSEK